MWKFDSYLGRIATIDEQGSISADHYDVIEKNIRHGEVIEKYPDRYVILMILLWQKCRSEVK
jgi:hypothetical protein